MRRLLNSLRAIHIKLIISSLISLVLFIILLAISNKMINSLDSQHMVERWSDSKDVAQISCFFAQDVNMNESALEELAYQIDAALVEAAITKESENESARLWLNAYSAQGTLSLSRQGKNIQVKAMGIGGDFFRFHPMNLVNGGYFYGSDLMQDYCVLDTMSAWRLFGSNDIVGMTVDINSIPHVVVGVVEQEEGRLLEAAGLSEPVVYVSYQTLSKHGANSGINHYEVVMPNPIKNFAFNMVKEKIGVSEQKMDLIENSSRFSLWNRIKLISTFGTRSMTGKAIVYPYWENIARGYEDILLLITFFMLLFILYPTILLMIAIRRYWKHKIWTFKGVFLKIWNWISEKISKMHRKQKANRKNKKMRFQEEDYEEEL